MFQGAKKQMEAYTFLHMNYLAPQAVSTVSVGIRFIGIRGLLVQTDAVLPPVQPEPNDG